MEIQGLRKTSWVFLKCCKNLKLQKHTKVWCKKHVMLVYSILLLFFTALASLILAKFWQSQNALWQAQ